jgi:hypothetical protein
LKIDTQGMNRLITHTITPALLLALTGCASSNQQARSTDAAQHAGSHPQAQIEITQTQYELSDENGLCDVPTYENSVDHLTNEQIRAELEAMFEYDRQIVSTTYAVERAPDAISAVRAIDKANAARLKEIVNHIGWPTRQLVGLKATQAAYMVIQHAGHDVDFQNDCLSMMVDLVEQGELPASYVALLTDRIRVFSNQPQVFGTQMRMARNELGVMVPTPTVPIEDPENLDERRALMGMVAHGQFVEAIQLAYEASLTEPNSAFASAPTSSE